MFVSLYHIKFKTTRNASGRTTKQTAPTRHHGCRNLDTVERTKRDSEKQKTGTDSNGDEQQPRDLSRTFKTKAVRLTKQTFLGIHEGHHDVARALGDGQAFVVVR